MSDYFSALLEHWVSLMSGVISLLLGIGLRIGKRISATLQNWSDVPDWIFVIAGTVCLVFAGYQTWSDEHRKLVAISEQRPRIAGVIEDLTVGNIQGLPVTWLIIHVTNAGLPSAVGPYNLVAHLAGGRLAQGQRRFIPPATTITHGNIVEYAYGEDALDVKTVRPIQPGERIYGRLLYAFGGIPIQDLDSLQTFFELSFTDVFQNPYSARWDSRGTLTQAVEFPALHPRFTAPLGNTKGTAKGGNK